jgi:hypothetical protein
MYLKDNYKINKELMLCTNVREIPFSYMKLLLINKCVQNDRLLVKIESRLLET